MRNGNLQKVKILIASLVSVLAMLADIYIIVNHPNNYILLGIISVIIMIAVYLIISGKIQLRDWEKLREEEKYSNMVESQRACYILVRKSFRELSETLLELDQKINPLANAGEINYKKISGILDEVMQEQRKFAKFTVSRNKENANAMMNSNDKVIEVIFKLQEAMSDVMERLEDKEGDDCSKELAEIEKKQQELLLKMQQLEESFKSKIDSVAEKCQEISVTDKKITEEDVSKSKLEEELELEQEKVILENELELDLDEELELQSQKESVLENELELVAEEFMLESNLGNTQEELKEKEEVKPVIKVESEKTPSDNPNRMLNPDEIAALISGSMEEPVSGPEVIEIKEKLPMPDTSDSNKPVSLEEIEPVVKVEMEKPPSDNPNRMLNPEEIAALISGNMEEPISEPEVIETKEKPPMPDMSDPNRPMSPEEIAALIANM